MSEIILGVALFTIVILALVMIILFARKQLVATGNVTININDDAEKSQSVEQSETIWNDPQKSN